MNTTKIISYIGMERCDMIYYLASIMEKKKVRTLVIDNSISHDLFLSLKRADDEAKYLENGRIVYIRDICYSEEFFQKFDLVLVYHGYNMDYDLAEASDKIIIACDYFKSTMDDIADNVDINWINEEIPDDKILMIYRDKLSGKITEEYVKRTIGLKNPQEEYVISFDEDNMLLYQNFTYNGRQDEKGISSEMRTILYQLRDEVFGKKKGKIKKEEDDGE